MRYFAVLNIEHFVMYLFPTLVFIIIFAAGRGYARVRRKGSEERATRIIESYPGGIEGRNAPFPLVVSLIIVGTVVWCLLYIISIGVGGVKI
jgi:hypothetical protein